MQHSIKISCTKLFAVKKYSCNAAGDWGEFVLPPLQFCSSRTLPSMITTLCIFQAQKDGKIQYKVLIIKA